MQRKGSSRSATSHGFYRIFIMWYGALLLAGCSPRISTVYLAGERYPSRPATHPIRLYTETAPECPYEELALVVASRPVADISLEEVTESLRKSVREMGGDAVIRLKLGPASQATVSGDSASISISTTSSTPMELSGTAIRFLREDCTK